MPGHKTGTGPDNERRHHGSSDTCRALPLIIALAGHVDHGKTALIRALTGAEGDRAPEARRRGMTIDLGFAYRRLPDGGAIGFIDVPGHERFIANMLAGVLAVDHALLVVAADDGPMPQTLEHLEILRLTGVPELIAVLSKIDRVDLERQADAAEALRRLLDSAGYGAAPILPVSSHTDAGIAALAGRLDALAARPRPAPAGGFRLAIDRSFILPGTGLVVTGTVAAGQVAPGDALLLTPARIAARVRGLHVQDQPAESARAGDRCALAIAGARLERAVLRRGDWLVAPALHAPTDLLTARVRLAEGRSLRHGAGVQLHAGAARVPARLRVLGGEGEALFVQLALARPLAALHGDRIVLRDEGNGRVAAGGEVIEPFASQRRRPRQARVAALAAQARPDPRQALAGLLALEGWVALAGFARARNLDLAELSLPGLDAARVGRDSAPILLGTETRNALRASLLAALAEFHAAQPDLPGPGQATLLRGARPVCPPEVAEPVLAELLAEGRVLRQDAVLRLPGHVAQLAEADAARWPMLAARLRTAGLRPPRLRELAEEDGEQPEQTEALLERLQSFGLLLRVAPNRFFLPDTVAELAAIAARLAEASEDGSFTAAEFNRASGIGRNLAIEVLEFLDESGVTRREGNRRTLRHAG
ncbi:MAG TPA: selenocysteine-specific translation elongation factor [Acetobacteraceae bacterium]